MQNGECRMENGEWRMENGEWRMENANSCLWTVFDENFFGAYIDINLDKL